MNVLRDAVATGFALAGAAAIARLQLLPVVWLRTCGRRWAVRRRSKGAVTGRITALQLGRWVVYRRTDAVLMLECLEEGLKKFWKLRFKANSKLVISARGAPLGLSDRLLAKGWLEAAAFPVLGLIV